ncbi:MAG: hypothetical protein NC340_08005 [Ruminococcus flavefaciens]|nr:hypothetical protein [Ruminococcus flavefaciens]MCM1229921.1 hypothetical protein [Ruminococcus flavefaciens]
MKKFTEILSFIITGIFVIGGIFLALGAISAGIEMLSYSPSTGLGEVLNAIFMPFVFAGIIIIGLIAVSAIGSGLLAFFLIKTANEKFYGNDCKVERIILKCIAYGILAVNLIIFITFFIL